MPNRIQPWQGNRLLANERDLPGDGAPVPLLPVPKDILVYTEEEFGEILARGDLFSRDMQGVVWL